jgi:hypothetical protein
MVRAACAAPCVAGCTTPGSGTPSRVCTNDDASPIDEHLGMAGNRQVGLDERAAGAIERHAERLDQRRGRDARRPEHRGGGDALVSSGRLHVDAVRIDADDARLLADLHTQAAERPARASRRSSRKLERIDGPPPPPRSGPARCRCLELVAQRSAA